jgi:toxin CptA
VRPIQLDLKPSPSLAAVFAIAGVGACAILAFMPLPGWLKLGLVLAVALAGTYHVMDALLRLQWSLVGLELNGRGELHVRRRDSLKQQVQVLPTSVVMPMLTLLNLKIEGTFRHRHMLITPDRADPEAYRQLRVWLRWSRQPISDAEAAEEV